MQAILENTPRGLFCPPGGFYVDPTRPVKRAVVSHAHADHARWGCKSYLSSETGRHLMRMRVGTEAEHEFLAFGETAYIGGVKISLHPAGHMLGSAQIRLEYRGQVAVITGDYKLGNDPTCASWEPVRCHLLV
ncbi:MAG: DNA ligase-associated DEXH box helicase, partial [Planctomycetota bacterium]